MSSQLLLSPQFAFYVTQNGHGFTRAVNLARLQMETFPVQRSPIKANFAGSVGRGGGGWGGTLNGNKNNTTYFRFSCQRLESTKK